MGLVITNMKIPSVNHALLKAKLFYFFFVSAMVTLLPYLYLYYKHVMFLSPKQVTILMAARPICLIVAAPLWGTVADKTNKFRPVMLMCLAAYIITYGIASLIEPPENVNCTNISERYASTNLSALQNGSKSPKKLQTTTRIRDDYYYPGRLMEDSLYSWPFSMEDYESYKHMTSNIFKTLLVLIVLGELLSSPAYTFADVYTLQTLESDTHRYGYQILPGVIGTGILSLIMVLLTHVKLMKVKSLCEKTAILSDKPFLTLFLAFIGLSFVVAIFFKYHTSENNRKRQTIADRICSTCKIMDAFKLMLSNVSYSCFMFIVLLCGVADSAKMSFAYTFIGDLGISHNNQHLLPLITTIHVLSHIVFLVLSPYLIKRFGHMKLVTAGVLVYAISFIVYGILDSPVWIMVIEPLDGIARQLARVAIITFVGSPPEIGAALQGLTHALYLGLGAGIGTFICGYIVHKYGYIMVFIMMGVLYLIGFGFCLAVNHYFPCEKTIFENFSSVYSQLPDHGDESDFDFLLREMNSEENEQKEGMDTSDDHK